MIGPGSWLAWIMIGGAASLAAMIWPFRRGTLGVLVNLTTGVCGALLGVAFSYWLLPWRTHGDSPARLFFAALGAIGLLALVHAVYRRVVDWREASVRT